MRELWTFGSMPCVAVLPLEVASTVLERAQMPILPVAVDTGMQAGELTQLSLSLQQ